MAGRVVRLRTRADRLRAEQAEELRQQVLAFADGRRISERAVGEIVAAIDRETAASSGWSFLMVNPVENHAVVEWLSSHSHRPLAALRLWSTLLMHVRRDTDEIVQTRAELAASVGIKADHVSEIMGELASINAIRRERDGRGVRYYLSPLVGTHLAGAARDRAQAEAPRLRLVEDGAPA